MPRPRYVLIAAFVVAAACRRDGARLDDAQKMVAYAVKPAVVNLAVGGGANTSIDTAVNNLANSGVFVAAVAGSSNADACNYSPGRAAGSYTVAASTSTDAKTSSTNYGSCVDIYSPGASITSTWYTSTTATNTISGTSMASPHVAGVAALYLSGNPTASPATVNSWIINNATPGVINNVPPGTPNRLLYMGGL